MELSGGRPADRPAPSRAPLGQLRGAELNGLTLSAPADARERRAVRREEHQQHRAPTASTPALRDEPGLSDAARRNVDQLLLHGRLLERAGRDHRAGIGCTSGGQRDAFRLEGQKRTDLAVNYTHRLGGARASICSSRRRSSTCSTSRSCAAAAARCSRTAAPSADAHRSDGADDRVESGAYSRSIRSRRRRCRA